MISIKIDVAVYEGEELQTVIDELKDRVADSGLRISARIVREVGDAGHPEVEFSGNREAITELIAIWDEAEA